MKYAADNNRSGKRGYSKTKPKHLRTGNTGVSKSVYDDSVAVASKNASAGNQSKLRFIPMFVFLAFIFGLGGWFVLNPKLEYSSSEKRYLQKFPKVTAENVLDGKFSSDFEKYFADHFPQRKLWVGTNSYYNLSLGNNGADGIYFCDKGYLVNEPVTDSKLITSNIGVIADFSKNVEAPVTAMFVPSAGYIMDDILPAVHNSYRDDEWFAESQKRFADSNINFVDLRESFKNEYKNGTQLYYKTDHHWTTEGAYLGYTELCKSLGTEPVKREAFDIETYEDFYGTTYSTGGFWLNEADNIEVWNNKANTAENISVEIVEGMQSEIHNSMFFYEHIEEDDKYPVFIDGNHAFTRIKNTKAQGGKILVVKDSFSHCIAPFLAESYSEVVLVDMRYYKESVSQLAQSENFEQILVLYGAENLAKDADIKWLE